MYVLSLVNLPYSHQSQRMMKYKPIYPSQESVSVAQSLSCAEWWVEFLSQSHFWGSFPSPFSQPLRTFRGVRVRLGTLLNDGLFSFWICQFERRSFFRSSSWLLAGLHFCWQPRWSRYGFCCYPGRIPMRWFPCSFCRWSSHFLVSRHLLMFLPRNRQNADSESA